MKKIYITIIRSIDESGTQPINECAVFSTRAKACKHLKNIVGSYKEDCFNQYIEDGDVGFDEETEKDYVMLESKDSFSFYAQGRYNDDHCEVWIVEKQLDDTGGFD